MTNFFTIILLITSTLIYAQDQIAKDVLDKLSSTTKSYENMTIEFNFNFENKSQSISENQVGKLILAGENFKLEMNGQTIINDGENQWVYLKDVNEVQIMEHDPEENMMSPSKLFTIYENSYKYNYIGSKLENGKKLQIIDLFPTESGPFIKFNIAVNSTANQLERITMHDKNGGAYTYLVTSFIKNTKITPFKFNYKAFPGVEVIDLR